MKKIILIIFYLLLITNTGIAQNYPNVANYWINGTPTHGVKIKTNLPYDNGTQMPTITITGYSYGLSSPMSLTLVYYIYGGNFYSPRISSSGDYTPKILLSNENGKVVIFIDDRVYFQRFTVSAFAGGMSEVSQWFQGWSVVDEALSGTNTIEVPYANKFKGTVNVDGLLRAKEVKVETGWADFVFDKNYKLLSLPEVEKYIQENGHLPGIPTEKVVGTNGVSLGEMNVRLLQKVEELTIYLIQHEKEISDLKEENRILRDQLQVKSK